MAQAVAIVNGINQALAESDPIPGVTIQYEDWDDSNLALAAPDPAKEAENARRASLDTQIVAYIGPMTSGAAKESIPILNAAGMVQVSPSATYPGLTKDLLGAVQVGEPARYYPRGPHQFARVVPSDDVQAKAAANWMKDLGATKVAALDDNDLYGRGVNILFAQKAVEVGLKVLGPQSLPSDPSQYTGLAQALKANGVDAVFFGGNPTVQTGKLWRDLRAVLGANFTIMAADALYDADFIQSAGPAAEGTYITFGGIPADKLSGAGAAWYRRYLARYRIEPGPYAAYGYEATAVILEGIRRVGKPDRDAVREAVLGTNGRSGILGVWSFTKTGDTTLTSFSGLQVRSGKVEFVKFLSAG